MSLSCLSLLKKERGFAENLLKRGSRPEEVMPMIQGPISSTVNEACEARRVLLGEQVSLVLLPLEQPVELSLEAMS